MAKISGYLKDGAGQAVAECAIILTALKTSNQVIEQIESYTTTKDGFYEINALTGQYDVTLTIAGHPPKKVGVITVYNDSPNGTLNDFLANGIDNQAVTPLFLSQLIEERQKAQQAAQAAQKSATQASSTLANVVKKTGDTITGCITADIAPLADIRSAPDFSSATSLNRAVLSQNYRWGIFNGSDKAELGSTANMTLVSWNGVGFAPLFSGVTKNTNNTVVINTRNGTLNALGGVYENNIKLPNKNQTYIKKNIADIGNTVKYILLAEGKASGLSAGNISLLVSGMGNFGGQIQQTDIISFSTRNGGNLKVTNLVQSDRANTRYGIEKTLDNKFKLWMKTGPYTASVGVAKISGESSNSIVNIVNEPVLQDSEPDNITYATSEVILKQGDGGICSTSLPSLNDFKSLANKTGFYQALGAKTPSPTTNAPPGSNNSRLTVSNRSDGSVAHYEVIENHAKSPRKWIGQYYTGSEMKWVEVITTANSTIDANGFYKKASPVVRLVNPASQLAIDACVEDSLQQVGDGFANDQAIGVQVKYLTTGHYQVQGSLGFAKSGWYIETPQDANGNKKLFVEYDTDKNNLITVKTYQNCFENGRFVAGDPMDIPNGRWIDIRLMMPETLAE